MYAKDLIGKSVIRTKPCINGDASYTQETSSRIIIRGVCPDGKIDLFWGVSRMETALDSDWNDNNWAEFEPMTGTAKKEEGPRDLTLTTKLIKTCLDRIESQIVSLEERVTIHPADKDLFEGAIKRLRFDRSEALRALAVVSEQVVNLHKPPFIYPDMQAVGTDFHFEPGSIFYRPDVPRQSEKVNPFTYSKWYEFREIFRKGWGELAITGGSVKNNHFKKYNFHTLCASCEITVRSPQGKKTHTSKQDCRICPVDVWRALANSKEASSLTTEAACEQPGQVYALWRRFENTDEERRVYAKQISELTWSYLPVYDDMRLL